MLPMSIAKRLKKNASDRRWNTYIFGEERAVGIKPRLSEVNQEHYRPQYLGVNLHKFSNRSVADTEDLRYRRKVKELGNAPWTRQTTILLFDIQSCWRMQSPFLKSCATSESVAELDAVQSVVQQLSDGQSARNEWRSGERLSSNVKELQKVRRRIDPIIRVLPIPTIGLVTFFVYIKRTRRCLGFFLFAVLLLLLLTLIKNLAVTLYRNYSDNCNRIVFTIAIYSSEVNSGIS